MLVFSHLVIYGCNLQGFAFTDRHVICPQESSSVATAICLDEIVVTRGLFLLLAAKVRSSCEEGPGQSALQSAYHDPQLDVTELKQHRTT